MSKPYSPSSAPSGRTRHTGRHRQRTRPATASHAAENAARAETPAVGAGAAPLLGPEIKEMTEQGKNHAAELIEELAGRVPKPMLAGLGIGLVVGGATVHFLGRGRKEESHVGRINAERARPSSTEPKR